MPKKVVSRQPAERKQELPYISASMRSSFKRCRYQWHFRYMRKLEPKITAPQLRFGTLIHTGLEHYYKPGVKRGPHPARVFEKAYEKEFGAALTMGFRDDDGKWHDALSLGVDMLEHYVEHYGKEEEWEVLATEQTFVQPVYAMIGRPPRSQTEADEWRRSSIPRVQIANYIGVLDLILRNRSSKEIWIRDHKSAKSIDTGYLAMDDQSSGYWTYGEPWLREQGILKPSQSLQGIQFNFLRKAKRDERPQNEQGHYLNQDGSVSKVQPPEFFHRHISYRGEHERKLTRERIAAEVQEMGLVKAGTLALLKSPDKMNCKFCDVSDICELHETGSDWEGMMRLIMVNRRPIRKEAIEFEHEH